MNLFEKMSAITMEISAVAKNLNVDMGRNSYKAVGEADILAAVKPIEAKHGVYSYPVSRRVIESAVITTAKKDYETKQQFLRMEVTYRFVNMEKPVEYIEMTTYGDGVDPQDKAPGKAMTYADKYALMKAYKISTGDDPDQTASTEENYRAAVVACTGCGSVIESTRKRDGEIWTASDIAAYSNRRFGRILCPDCQRKAMKSEG